MENLEIINLWKSQNSKLEESLSLNRKAANEITKIKVRSLISSLKPIKVFTIVIGVIWVILGDSLIADQFIYNFNNANPFFLFSATIQLIITTVALVLYIYQLILIHQIDTNISVINTQKKLAKLMALSILVVRILFLQLPVWTTFYLTDDIFESENIFYLIFNSLFTLVFCYAAHWLFVNIKYENRNKKWFNLIFIRSEWAPVMDSIALYKDLESY